MTKNPKTSSPIKPHFFQPLLPGFHRYLSIPVRFFVKHIEGRHEGKTANLSSAVSYRTWEVKMDGRRFTDGWEKFSQDHDLRVGDVIVFRHDGDTAFHVTFFGTSFCHIQYAPLHPDYHDNDSIGNVARVKDITYIMKKPKTEAETSLDSTGFKGSTADADLCSDTMKLPINLARSNVLNKIWDKTERRSIEKKTQLIWRVHSSPRQNRFVTLTRTPKFFKEHILRLPRPFTRVNGIDKPGKITLLDKHGVEWQTSLWTGNKYRTVTLGRGSSSFCEANGVRVGESFMLELIWRDTTPILSFYSKIHRESPKHKTVAKAVNQPEEARPQRITVEESVIKNETQMHERVVVDTVLDAAGGKGSKPQADGSMDATSVRGAAENPLHTTSFSATGQVAKTKQTMTYSFTTLRQLPEVLVKEEHSL